MLGENCEVWTSMQHFTYFLRFFVGFFGLTAFIYCLLDPTNTFDCELSFWKFKKKFKVIILCERL